VDVAGLWRSRAGRQVALVLACVVAAGAGLAAAVAAAVPAQQRDELRTAVAAQAGPLVLLALLALAGLAVLLVRVLGAHAAAARRLTADVRLVLEANPEHRLDASGSPELVALAAAVDELAERRAAAERETADQVAAARADVEQERTKLAALVADLTVAVLVCSRGGRVLLYNHAARTLLGDDPALGLGRSVFALVDRGLITHALDRIADGGVHTHVSTVLRDGRLLQVRFSPVRTGDQVTGFVLLLEDTSHLEAQRRRDTVLRELVEGARSSTGAIRAAVETVLDYTDMAPEERAQFLQIVSEESQRLSAQVEGWAAEVGEAGVDWHLADIRGADLLVVLRREVERRAGTLAATGPVADDLWVRADSHALARALEQAVERLSLEDGVERVTLSLAQTGRHARLDVGWTGRLLDGEALRAWLDSPLSGGGEGRVREVVERHDGEVWSTADEDGSACLSMLLPLSAAARRQQQALPPPGADVRPDYDFDLFDLPDQPDQPAGWQDRRLADLDCTVFDTETTGFSPAADEIVSIGAVRVVGGRLRRSEVFERLVDPRRPVPAASSAVHGITDELVRGQPALKEVLPLFARFCEDTVLVGHNVGFDMSFLRAREARTGVRFPQPVLDTLLLDAAAHPDHEEHSLESMATRLGVDVVGRHTALGDALVTGEVFVRLLDVLQGQGITTLGQALEASRTTYQARLGERLYGS
jgi:DNA polymerase-3 subunit epsilon